MVAVRAESMVGGTIFGTRFPPVGVIQREISRVLVLNPLWQKSGAKNTGEDTFVLDTAFALIEGHPTCDCGIRT